MPRNDLKAYTTLMARIPQELADAVKQYASQHRCTVSELIRDGLEMRLEAGEVPGRSTGSSPDHGDEVIHEVIQVLPEVLQRLSPLLLAQIQDTIRTTVTGVLHGMTEVGYGHTSLPQPHTQGMPSLLPFETPAPVSTGEGMTGVLHEVLPGHTSTSHPCAPRAEKGHTEVVHVPGANVPAFDMQRYILGKLCARQHEWGTTGQSLLKKSNKGCPQCNTEQARERRARQKAAQVQEG